MTSRRFSISRTFASLAIWGCFVTTSAFAQPWSIPALPSGAHVLDGLLGGWTYVERGKGFTATGTWTFSRSADGFVIYDQFRTPNGKGGTAIVVDTFRAFNPTTQTWNFQAVTYQAREIGARSGEWDSGTTVARDGQIVDEIRKGNMISRVRFYDITNERFQCSVATSADAGKTWGKTIRIEAVRSRTER
ncbi:MAG: hypothetical protein JOZ77_03340 [Candidatus Eremiobacteraeota bacterium]|nr:hypothetical protein [Candidatus Eremiobacteraeota bacterium]